MRVRIPVDGAELWAEDSGGDGSPVVLVHGDWTDSRIWDPLLPLLSGQHRVIRYDLRGFGRSTRPTGSFTRLRDLGAVLGHLGLGQVILAGHSGGGGTALGLALREPDRVRALALVAPGIHDYPWPADDGYFRACGPLIEAADHDGLLRLGQRTWAPSGTDAAVTAMMRGAVSSWFQIGDLEEADPPGFGLLGQVRLPSVMLLGGREYPVVAEVSRAIAAARRLPDDPGARGRSPAAAARPGAPGR
jgi:pimeloyl-ACP methyl ester carboxylesterase